MYRAVTRKIEVMVTPRFVTERSSPSNGYYFWTYTINITNLGAETAQLKTRHWRITDALGRLQEVKGPGVVGEEPTLKPGESFEYTSGVPLPTPSGFGRTTCYIWISALPPSIPRHASGCITSEKGCYRVLGAGRYWGKGGPSVG